MLPFVSTQYETALVQIKAVRLGMVPILVARLGRLDSVHRTHGRYRFCHRCCIALDQRYADRHSAPLALFHMRLVPHLHRNWREAEVEVGEVESPANAPIPSP